MLNRFKSVLYGSSSNTDQTSPSRTDYDYREYVNSKRTNSALTRSSSFREDLLRDSGKNRINNTHLVYESKSKEFDGIPTAGIGPQYSSSTKDDINDRKHNYKIPRLPKFRYSRPEFLQLKTDDEILVSADHQIRPIILPRDVSRLPWKSGYAECINAGKSLRNEDQAASYQDVVIKRSSTSLQIASSPEAAITNINCLPWAYFGIFDGHAGTAVAVAAATQLHNIISDKLGQIEELLVGLEFEVEKEEDSEYVDCDEKMVSNKSVTDTNAEAKQAIENNGNTNSIVSDENSNDLLDKPEASSNEGTTHPQESKTEKSPVSAEQVKQEESPNIPEKKFPISMIDICRNNISVDSLITGVLESAFWEMDALIAQDKHDYKMPGGCTAIVGLFILGKLYVCNAGDSRAIVYKNNQVLPMSFDFTPTSERKRILRLGLQHPEFLGTDFTHLEFIRRPTRRDLGKQMLYRDAYMTGWAMKTITYDDLRFPLVWGEGKRSRVLATIGVTRGFGDHELRAQYGSVLIKPFLTPEPEVKVLPLETDQTLSAEDVLIIGSDGLWDVTSNQEAADIVKSSFDHFPDNEETRSKYRYITAAQDLVIHSRGHTTNWNNVWRTSDDRLASLDDIAVFVIPLKQYRDEYTEWKKSRSQNMN